MANEKAKIPAFDPPAPHEGLYDDEKELLAKMDSGEIPIEQLQPDGSWKKVDFTDGF